MRKFITLLKSEDGATAIEYAFIAGGISIAIMAAVFLLGDDLGGLFNFLADTMGSYAGKI